MTTAAAQIRLGDPDSFADGPPHEAFAELRRTQPVVWQEMDGEPGFFAVLRHADVLTVSHAPNLYSSSLGGIMLEDPPVESLAMSRDMLVGMDPPRHGGYRRPVIPCFKPRAVGQLEDQIRQLCRDIMAESRELGPDVEFVHDVSAKLPTRVMGRLMGLPEKDWPYVHRISEQMLAGQDPDITSDESDRHSIMELFAYAMQFAADRRTVGEQGDVTDVLLSEDFDGKRMTDADFASFFCQLVGAGNDTTKTLTAAGVVALGEHPEQLADLKAHPELTGSAVEEMLRYANPVHYTRRTTSADTELAGVAIPQGSKVAVFFTSANRDETVFTDPQAFDIRRSPNRHLTFGFAEHFCLGAHLARLEARLFFEELLTAYPDFALAGEPVRLRSNFTNGHRKVPVRLWPQ